MPERARPPDDIPPGEFFTRWVPEQVARDRERQRKLADTEATLEFELTGEGGGVYTVRIQKGEVRGAPGAAGEPDLRIQLDVDTWRSLNRGTLSAPEAALKRRVRLQGNLLLAIKLHLILG